MSAKKSKNPYSDYEFLRAAFVERQELQDAHCVSTTTSITVLRSPHRLLIRHEAWDLKPAARPDVPLCSCELEWPNASEMGFAAALFRSSVTLTRLVEDSRADSWRATLRAQDAG